jgi:hypothetical protein
LAENRAARQIWKRREIIPMLKNHRMYKKEWAYAQKEWLPRHMSDNDENMVKKIFIISAKRQKNYSLQKSYCCLVPTNTIFVYR